MNRDVRTAAALMMAAGLAVLGGCNVGPEAKAPEPTQVDGWSASLAGAGLSPDPVANAAWWEQFNDPALNSLVQRAVEGNKDLAIAAARVREARAARGVVAADSLPTLDASGGYTRSQNSETTRGGRFNPGSSESFDTYQAGFDANWEIDLWGRVRRSVEAADADVAAAEEARRDTLVVLLGEVGRNYVEVRSLQRRLEIARANIRSQSQSLDLTTSRFNAGLTSELDVAQARSQLANTQAVVPSFESALEQTLNRLAVLTGQQPGALKAEFAQTGPLPAPPEVVAIGMPGDALRRRADVRRAEREISAATARIGVATADLYPRVRLLGSFGFQTSQFASLFDGDSRAWSVGPSISWNVFDGGRIRSNIKVFQAREQQALLGYQRTVLGALEEANNAIVAYDKERQRRARLMEAEVAARRAVALSEAQYQAGKVAFLQVLDSQRSLFAAQDNLAASDAVVSANLVAVYKALGGAWEPFEQPAEVKERMDEGGGGASGPGGAGGGGSQG